MPDGSRSALDRLFKQYSKQSVKVLAAAADPFFPSFGGPRLLVYHQIDAGLGREMEVSRDVFIRQISWLQDNTEIVSLDEAWARRAEPDADRLVVLTFDDGYDDMYRLAYPVLVEQRLPFVLYLTTHPTETGEALFSGADPCTWQQVEAMAASGLMTLGAHTHRHNDLREVTVDQAMDDLGTSNEIIQARMGVSAQHFCYPYGFWSETAHGPVASMYHTAVLGSGPPIGADTDPLLIPRVPVQLSDGMVWFKRKMRSGLQLEDRIRRRYKGYTGP